MWVGIPLKRTLFWGGTISGAMARGVCFNSIPSCARFGHQRGRVYQSFVTVLTYIPEFAIYYLYRSDPLPERRFGQILETHQACTSKLFY